MAGPFFKDEIMKIISHNKKARHEFHILDTCEAGIILNGDEVKALRAGHCSLTESFARMDNGEAVLYKMNIPEYKHSSVFTSPSQRDRRLLMHKREIYKFYESSKKKGLTIVPLKVYFNDKGRVKIELGLCQGKKMYDKRASLKESNVKREIAREMKKYK